MNDRLLKLAEKHQFVHEHMSPGEKADAIRKFQDIAEVIVRECIQICQSEYNKFVVLAAKNNGRESDFAFGRIDSAERIKDDIKQHFGVE